MSDDCMDAGGRATHGAVAERPAWCPKKDCEFLHAVQDRVCAGRMSALDSQETGFSTRTASACCSKASRGG